MVMVEVVVDDTGGGSDVDGIVSRDDGVEGSSGLGTQDSKGEHKDDPILLKGFIFLHP